MWTGAGSVMVGARSPWVLEAGEHVCWQVRSAKDYADGEHELITHARRAGGGVLVLGGARALATRPLPAGDPAMLADLRRQAHAARRDGRLLWVLATMEQLTRPEADLHEVVACELELAELAAETDAGIVCAYQTDRWHSDTLGDLATVHSRVVGLEDDMTGFHLRYARASGYRIEGTVGYECVRAFAAALRGALRRSPRVTLGCERLELIDAAGWRALVEAVADVPGAQVVLDGANETILETWHLSGYATPGITVRGGSR
jgi:hypothetical protein